MPQSNFDEIIEKYVEIKKLLRKALTDDIDNREVYMKGIDASYFYEGYILYKTEDLQLLLKNVIIKLSQRNLEKILGGSKNGNSD